MKTKSTFVAIAILGVMAVLLFASSAHDSAITDELAHIPAGYAYVALQDYRLNPEHPPLLKMLAGASTLLFARPHFPIDTKAWTTDLNGQWDQGNIFLFHAGNDPDAIIFWARFPMILLTLLFAWILFAWTRKYAGSLTALMTLTLFAFSPTVLAHGRYVTTDIGAAFGFFIGIIGFLRFLKNPTTKNTVIAGVLFGISLLCKFSTVLLLPAFFVVLVVWVFSQPSNLMKRFWFGGKLFLQMLLGAAISLAVIWCVYSYTLINYTQVHQLADATELLKSYGQRTTVNADLALIKNNLTRPIGQYVLGVLMVQQRAAGGNTAFFIGEVTNRGSRLYFPLLYLLKEPLAYHILSLIALGLAFWKARKSSYRGLNIIRRMLNWSRQHIEEFAFWIVILIYIGFSLKSPLNIGVRHVLPTFPFLYLLVSRQIGDWLNKNRGVQPFTLADSIKNIFRVYVRSLPKYTIVVLLLGWLIFDTIVVFPSFLSSYNELAGGTTNGYKIAVDSNYDWGQDLKRLVDYTNQNHIQKIAVDYFGGADTQYYLKDKYVGWNSGKGQPHGWFAISASFRQGAFGKAVDDFKKDPNEYSWLKDKTPVARAGYSIFIYHLP